MTTLAPSPISFLTWKSPKTAPKVDDLPRVNGSAARKIVGDMIAAGACDSEHGVHMLMSVYPDQF